MTETLTKLFGLVRDTLIADSDILDLVESNVYPEMDIAMTNNEFPCIIFEHIPGKPNEPSKTSAMDQFKFYIYSETSKKECYEIYDVLKDKFQTQSHYSDGNYHLNITKSGRPKVKTDFNNRTNKDLYFLEIIFDTYVAAI